MSHFHLRNWGMWDPGRLAIHNRLSNLSHRTMWNLASEVFTLFRDIKIEGNNGEPWFGNWESLVPPRKHYLPCLSLIKYNLLAVITYSHVELWFAKITKYFYHMAPKSFLWTWCTLFVHFLSSQMLTSVFNGPTLGPLKSEGANERALLAPWDPKSIRRRGGLHAIFLVWPERLRAAMLPHTWP